MKKRIMGLGAVILCMTAMLFTGCMRVGIDIDMKSDGTASLTAMYAISSGYYTEEDFADTEYEIKKFTIDGKDYMGYEITEDFRSFEELTASMTSLSEDNAQLFTSASMVKGGNPFVSTYEFSATVPNLLGEEDDDYSEMAASMITIDFNISMPGKVKETSGTINGDGSITFVVNPTAETICTATSSEVNFVAVACAAVGLIAVAAIVIGLTKRKSAQY